MPQDLLTNLQQRGGGREAAASDQYGIGATQSSQRFPQQASRQQPVMAKRTGGIQQDEVQLSMQATMLQAIIHDNHIEWVAAEQLPGGKTTVRVLHMRDAWNQQLKHLLFIVAAICRSVISATDDSRGMSQLLQTLAEHRDNRRFPGTAGRQITHADDGHCCLVNGQQAIVVEGVANRGDQSVEAGDGGQHHALSGRPQSAVCSADQSEKPGLIHGDNLTFERKQQSPGREISDTKVLLYLTIGHHSKHREVPRSVWT